MVAQDQTGQTPVPLPRNDIPDAWASSGHCPACGAAPLKVTHFPDLPDLLVCLQCELSFEVASNAGLVRVKHIPERLEFAEEEIRYRWVAPSVLLKIYQNRQELIQKKQLTVPLAALTDEEVWNRAFSLGRLGNEPWVIKQVLVQAGASQEQAEAALRRLKLWTAQNAKSQTQKLWWVAGIASLLVVLVMAGWFFTIDQINSALAQNRKTAGAQQGPVVPLQALNALPDAVKPGFLKSPASYVDRSGPQGSRCPGTAAAAAQLFGGEESMWKRPSQPDSWQMMNPGDPTTVRVPSGMYAGYIDNKSFIFLTVNGPATIHNINFIAITCF